MSRLEELQKAADEAYDAADAAEDAYWKAKQELEDYKKEHKL